MNTKTIDVTGVQTKIGEATINHDFPAGPSVEGTSLRSGSVKSLYLGGTGQGTTTALETEALDFYKWGRENEKEITIVDAAGFGEQPDFSHKITTIDPDTVSEWSSDETSFLSVSYEGGGTTKEELRAVNSVLGQIPDIDGMAVLLLRDLWKIAPSPAYRKTGPEIADLQEQFTHTLLDLLREARHHGLHVLADAQSLDEIHPHLRNKFNRYVVFTASRDNVKDIFSFTCNQQWKAFYSTLDGEVGRASIVGEIGLAEGNRSLEFLGPIRYKSPDGAGGMETSGSE